VSKDVPHVEQNFAPGISETPAMNSVINGWFGISIARMPIENKQRQALTALAVLVVRGAAGS